jgi:hypothetical protein
MSKFTLKISFSLIVILLFCVDNFSQSKKQDKPYFAVGIFGKDKIVYAKENDGLPKEILAKGTIVDASVAGTYCGTIATGGTLKIKLNEKVNGYDHEFLYVIVLCLAGRENEDIVGKQIELKLKKMTKFPYKYTVRLASLDSKGVPFYLSTIDGVGGLIEKLDSKSSEKTK